MWERNKIDIGNVLENTVPEVEFKYLGDLPINDIVVSCGCLTPIFDKESGILKVKFKTGGVPVHLRYKGTFVSRKTVNIYIVGKPKTELVIVATVQMKHYFNKV